MDADTKALIRDLVDSLEWALPLALKALPHIPQDPRYSLACSAVKKATEKLAEDIP